MHIYDALLKEYGPQGWWPLVGHAGTNPTKAGSVNGYHPGDYSFPKTENQVYEILVGAILTQNTSWPQVEKALLNLNNLGCLNPQRLLAASESDIKQAIKPAGYYNQKAVYLAEATRFFISLKGRTPTRDEVLAVKGIGNETADSIMLYAFSQPEFVVDAYTKRIFLHLGLISQDAHYMEIKCLFEDNIPKDTIVYQEYHALIVEHAKRYYSRKPYGVYDPLKKKPL